MLIKNTSYYYYTISKPFKQNKIFLRSFNPFHESCINIPFPPEICLSVKISKVQFFYSSSCQTLVKMYKKLSQNLWNKISKKYKKACFKHTNYIYYN